MAKIHRIIQGVAAELVTKKKSTRKVFKTFYLKEVDRLIKTVRGMTPVDTGLLSRSWRIKASFDIKLLSMRMVIDNVQEYASYVEDGTPKVDPQHMLQLPLLVFLENIDMELDRILFYE